MKLRDRVYLPILCQVLASNNQIYPNLLGLPEIDTVIAHLTPSIRAKLSITCRRLNEEIQEFCRRQHAKKQLRI